MRTPGKPIEAKVIDWILFFATFAPMFGIAAVRWEGPVLKLSLAALALAAAAPLFIVLAVASRQQAAPFEIMTINKTTDINAGFLATYLLPFLTTETPSRDALVAYALFIWILGVIFTRSRTVNTSPLLYMTGYDLANVETDRGSFVLISRQLPEIGETISAFRVLSGGILLEKHRD